MVFYIFYAVAIIILVLHFTGWLKRNNLVRSAPVKSVLWSRASSGCPKPRSATP